MKIILLISNNKEITDNISDFKPENLDFIVVKAEQYLSGYLEEYLPEYIIIDIPVKNSDLLKEYKKKNPAAAIFLNYPEYPHETKNPGFIYIDKLKNKNDIKNIINIISKIEIENKNVVFSNNYKLINQQIISVFSLKGGTGKTTFSFNLAYYIKRIFNARVILIDLNFCIGSCDLSSYIRSNQIPNMSYYIENHDTDEEALWKSIIINNDSDIDVLLPPLSLTQYNKISVVLLNELFNLIRGRYNFVIIDLPYSFNDLVLESIKLSNSLIFVSLPVYSCALKLSKFKTDRSFNALNRLSIINNPYNFNAISKNSFEDISEYPVSLEIPYIVPGNKGFINFNNKQTELIDMGQEIKKLINTSLII